MILGVVSTGVVTPMECPVGHYCSAGTETANQYPCDAGYYSNITGLTDRSECTSCPPGQYCEVTGKSSYAHRFLSYTLSSHILICIRFFQKLVCYFFINIRCSKLY